MSSIRLASEIVITEVRLLYKSVIASPSYTPGITLLLIRTGPGVLMYKHGSFLSIYGGDHVCLYRAVTVLSVYNGDRSSPHKAGVTFLRKHRGLLLPV